MTTVSLNNVRPALAEKAKLDIQKAQNPTFRGDSPDLQLKGQPDSDELVTASAPSKAQDPVPTWRAVLKRLPQETIDKANESGKLPPNMMVSWDIQTGQYRLAWKTPMFEGKLTGGSDTIPPTHELRQNVLGFTLLVPKDYNHWLIRDKKSEQAPVAA